MNKLFEYSHRLVDSNAYVPIIIEKHHSDVTPKDKSFLDYIFGVDPVTGVPIGDLSVYLGDKANPEIKAFIQSQLLQENNYNDSPLDLSDDVRNKFKTLSDDDIAFFSRNHDETKEEYRDRLRLTLLEERQKRANDIRDKAFQDEINRLRASISGN